MRGLRELHIRMSDGGDLHRPGDQARDDQSGRMRRVLCVLQRPEPGTPAVRPSSERCGTYSQMMRLRFDPEPDVCPTAAFEPDELAWPRVVRRAFSDPRVPHESTGVDGRGTEEVKTNDVTGRVKARRGGLHDRVRAARRRRAVP